MRTLLVCAITSAVVVGSSLVADAATTPHHGEYCGFYTTGPGIAFNGGTSDPILHVDLESGAYATESTLYGYASDSASDPTSTPLTGPVTDIGSIYAESPHQSLPDLFAYAPQHLSVWRPSNGALSPVSLPPYDYVGGPEDFNGDGQEGLLLGSMTASGYVLNLYSYDPSTGFNHAPSVTIPTGVSEATPIAYDETRIAGTSSTQKWSVARNPDGTWSAPRVQQLASSFPVADLGIGRVDRDESLDLVGFNSAMTQIAMLPGGDPSKPWVISDLPTGITELLPTTAGGYEERIRVLAVTPQASYVLGNPKNDGHFVVLNELKPAQGFAATTAVDSHEASGVTDLVQFEHSNSKTRLRAELAGFIPSPVTRVVASPGKKAGDLVISWTPPAKPCPDSLTYVVTVKDSSGRTVATGKRADVSTLTVSRLRSKQTYRITMTVASRWGTSKASTKSSGAAR